MSTKRLYIHGRYREATPGETFITRNPATGAPLADVQQASPADVDAAVASARKGFPVWSAMSGVERGRILLRAVSILRERNDELAMLESRARGWAATPNGRPARLVWVAPSNRWRGPGGSVSARPDPFPRDRC